MPAVIAEIFLQDKIMFLSAQNILCNPTAESAGLLHNHCSASMPKEISQHNTQDWRNERGF